MNWPNKLTVVRIALVPVIVMFLLVDSIDHRFLFAAFIFLVASVTDHIDGFIARKYNQITNFGKFADPLADKILVLSILVCFIELQVITALPIVIIISREFLVTSIRLVAAEKGDVISANIWGKIKTVSQVVCIFVIILISHFGNTSLFFWCEISVWITCLLTAISGVIYIKDNWQTLKTNI